ncbi:MAG: hypothetical protein HZA08_02325 [Nitrospirae bacterium]|nr:hypothetical protein [Nitrospirota bacterium]
MKRLQSPLFNALFFALMIILATGNTTQATTLYGTLSNFDVIDDTGHEGHGFEIELEGISSSDVVYTFGAPYQRYGNPTLVPTPTGVIVRYASPYNPGTGWAATTPLAPSPTPVTLGHQCWTHGDPNYPNSGCEHFGVSLMRNPTKTIYRWLIENTSAPGTLTPFGSNVSIPAPVWNVIPQPVIPPVVRAVIPAPPPPAPDPVVPIPQWGTPIWAKVFKTESPIPANLDALVLGNPAVPDGQDPIQVEVEWKLMQSPPAGKPHSSREVEIREAQAGAGNKSVTRRYEFYKYLGPVIPEDNEVLCDNPLNCPGAVGDFIGAQNAAVNINPINRLEVTKSGVGTGTVTSDIPGINCGASCLAIFDAGAVVTLTATPDAGYYFAGWSGNADCIDGIVTMDAAKTCTAEFTDTASIVGAIIISSGNVWTKTTSVTLSLSCIDNIPGGGGCKDMQISYDGVFDTELWEPYATTKAWTLNPGNGYRAVYVRFRDNAGNISLRYVDWIRLDTAKPVVSGVSDTPDPFSPNLGQASTIGFTLSDNLSGTCSVILKIFNSANVMVKNILKTSVPCTSAGTVTSVKWLGRNNAGVIVPAGIYTYKIQAYDKALNYSYVKSGTTTVQ